MPEASKSYDELVELLHSEETHDQQTLIRGTTREFATVRNVSVTPTSDQPRRSRGRTWVAGLAAAALMAAVLAAAVVRRAGGGSSEKDCAEGDTACNKESLVTLVGTKPTTIRWLAHPNKCFDVAGDHKGAALQIWDCGKKDTKSQEFFVPPAGATGRIQWAKDPKLCLDAPTKTAIMFWLCEVAPPKNLLWLISPDGKGRIHLASSPDRCINVPGEKSQNGWRLQMWHCGDEATPQMDRDMRFITHPVDCIWSPWREWGLCSASCGGGTRRRIRLVFRQPMNGGKACGKNNSLSEACNAVPCPTVATTSKATQQKPTTAPPTLPPTLPPATPAATAPLSTSALPGPLTTALPAETETWPPHLIDLKALERASTVGLHPSPAPLLLLLAGVLQGLR
mmetsp:Transcript_39415/g.91401  ORF Transcript_39415/g.91401 Transcript_39415/m.91401 type:complete len:396 (-) Transcript_39415:14-1201(-)